MTTEERIHDALLVINSKLEVIDGKVNLVARANRDDLLDQIEKAVRKHPIIGHVYLLLDGKRNQDAILTELKKQGIQTSAQALSRWIPHTLVAEHGMAELVPASGMGKVYRKNAEFEKALNLTIKIKGWLADLAQASSRPKKRG